MSGLITKLTHLIISFSFTFILLKNFIPIFKKIIPAIPNERGMHKIIKASSGGISFILIYTILVIYQGFYLPLLSLPIAIIGLIDDKYNISRIFRLLSQIISVLIIVFYLNNNPSNAVTAFTNHGFIGYFFIILFGVSIINFINFMDGIDGLICGSMIIIFLTLNGEIHYLLPIIGTLSAFLYFNWYPSKIFMGDTGSLFLGTYLVSIMYSTSSGIVSISKVFLLGSPLFYDSISCIIRRSFFKKNIFKAHKSHLYQRLVSNGIKHSVVATIYILAIALLSIFYLYSNISTLFIVSILIFLVGIFLDQNYAEAFGRE